MAGTTNGYSCRRCLRPIHGDRGLHEDIFEGMHLLCFHLEFEHPGDPDLPCDDPGCFVRREQILGSKLRELGHDPQAVIEAAIRAEFD